MISRFLDWGYLNQGKFWLIVGPPWAALSFCIAWWALS